MSASDHLGKYAEGWIKGDSDTVISSLADEYVLDDPSAGQISKAGFGEYFKETKEMATSMGGGGDPFMEITELVTSEGDGVLTAWAWWKILGTPMEGGGLIKVTDNGVISERLTNYAKPAE